jgi:metallophosphoesterase (TIGR00282 family)
MRVLFIGDVVGKPGRQGLRAAMPALRERFTPDAIVINAENSAGGVGVNEKSARDLFELGADALTLGNHAYRHRDSYEFLDREERIVRPANYPVGNPGRGSTVIEAGGMKLGILNLSGQVHLNVARNAFHTADAEVEKLAKKADAILVDFHAEVTSEKVALGWHLDGRVAAVLGTHTHVPTADARVLPKGTAVLTDVGMTGSRDGIIGVKREQAVGAFLTQMPVRFETAEENVWINGALVEINEQGLAASIEQVLMPAPQPGS